MHHFYVRIPLDCCSLCSKNILRRKQNLELQTARAIFNKGMLMNAGFLEIEKLTKSYDCYIFHDVDMIPENRCNYYTCFEDPLHLGAYVNKFKYK